MNLKKSSRSATSSTLIDSVIDGYVTWREESAAVAATYRDWVDADRHERELAYGAYLAALDREELAASAYRRLVELVTVA